MMHGKLMLADLRVESFATTPPVDDERGTVHGNAASVLSCRFSCPPKYTCPECAPPVKEERPLED